ncbi:MFS transporter [Bailinhaonella thermotolerans]|uniref:MFS transporter n=1 Tax=Bailinhaonella thermotolerans TaxID=1070861 RepID=A0A3A4APL1_9ACTN|nr:MFS transporter [Bailinhaonella thermotolerans]RJL31606.1 MFS transporter [Bailinhaonella thermotolerans]
MTAQPVFRLARAAVFSAVCVLLGVLGHVFAGGGLPGWAAPAGVGALVLAAAYALAGRERSPGLIVGFLLGAQLLSHELFRLGAPAPGPSAAHDHGGSAMLLAHLVAAALAGWWLARGEAALWSVLRRLAVRLLAVLASPAPIPAPGTAPRPAGGPVRPARLTLRHSLTRRGPPPCAAARPWAAPVTGR